MTANSMDSILRPRSIAVIGASRTPGTIGHEIVASLVRGGFTGAVHPVNPKANAICSIKAAPTIGSLAEPVDLAVVTVPKEAVLEVVHQAADHGVGGLVVISAGFREVGGDGRERERLLRDFVRERGIRMVGPNCMGVLNAEPDVRMNATFAPRLPPFGQAAFVSQSGAMGLTVLDYAKEYGIGFAQFVSVGNKADVSSNDLLLAWENDPTVGVILMYVENFGNPAKFLTIASRVGRKKPIIAMKSGRSLAGARAASSHTGALAASDAAVDALLRQAGVLRAGTIEELFDLAMAFSTQPAPKSRRTVVLTNAGGPGILAADALEPNGLELPELSDATVARLQPLFPAEASIRNPLDMIASATPAGYRTALDALLADPNVDSALAIFVPPLGVRQSDVTAAIAEAAQPHLDTPVFAILMGHEGLPQGRAELHEVGIPAYIFPESAARALAARCRYREWQERPPSLIEELPVDREAARRIIEPAVAAGRTRLSEVEALDLMAAYGLQTARARLARSEAEAVSLAAEAGGPVVLKVVAPGILHKTEVGGVQVDLRDEEQVRAAWGRIMAGATEAVGADGIDGVMVQPMVTGGRELILGMMRDRAFGPLVMFGLGGILVEVLKDVVFRIAPLGRLEARDLMDGIRGAALLGGVRGAPPVDRVALEDALLRISQLVVDFPVIQEIDMNPVLASERGVMVVDSRVLLAPAPTG